MRGMGVGVLRLRRGPMFQNDDICLKMVPPEARVAPQARGRVPEFPRGFRPDPGIGTAGRVEIGFWHGVCNIVAGEDILRDGVPAGAGAREFSITSQRRF